MTVAELNAGGTAEEPISTIGLEMVRANIQQIAWECVRLSIEARFQVAVWRHRLMDQWQTVIHDWEVQEHASLPQW